jgi:hypothetical protein
MKTIFFQRSLIFAIAGLLTIVGLAIGKSTFFAQHPIFAGFIPGFMLIVATLFIRKIPKSGRIIPYLFLAIAFLFIGRFFLLFFSVGIHFMISVAVGSFIASVSSIVVAAGYQYHLSIWHPGIGLAALLGGAAVLFSGLGVWAFESLSHTQPGAYGLIVISAFWVFGTGLSFCFEPREDVVGDDFLSKIFRTFGKQ